MSRLRNLFVSAAVLVWLPAALAVIWLLSDRLDDLYSICIFQRVWKYPCPGCGMTRAVGCMLHGQLHKSLALHPLAGPTLLAGGAVWVFGIGMRFRGWKLPRASTPLTLAAIGVFAVVWVGRIVHYMKNGLPEHFR